MLVYSFRVQCLLTILCCLIITGCSTTSKKITSKGETNILKNGNFEKFVKVNATSKIKLPEKWTAIYFPRLGYKAGLSKDAAKGNFSIFLEMPKNTIPKKTISWQSDYIATKSGNEYNLAFQVKIVNLIAGSFWRKPGVMIIYYNKKRERIKHSDLFRFGSDIKKWSSFSKKFKVPDNNKIAYLRVAPVLSYSNGKVMFDDFVLKKIKKKKFIMPTQKNELIIFPAPKAISTVDKKFLLKGLDIDFSELQNCPQDDFIRDSLVQIKKDHHLSDKGTSLKLHIDKNMHDNNEYYTLKITPEKILLSATSKRGILYGIQTFIQLLDSDNSIPCVEIKDWPDFKLRGFITGARSLSTLDRLLPYKFNFCRMCGPDFTCRKWMTPMTSKEKKYLSKLTSEALKRFIQISYGLRPGYGKNELHFSDEKHIDAILAKYKDMYDCGIRNFYLAFDDLFNIGRDKLSFADDKKRFGNIGEAHFFLANRVYSFLQSLNKANKLDIVPMYYYDPTSYSLTEKNYLRALGRLPQEVEFINCGTFSKKSVANLEDLINRKPFFWSNFMAQYEGIKPRPELLSPLTFQMSPQPTSYFTGFMFVLWPKHTMMKQLFSDFLWNADKFDPDKSFAMSMMKNSGGNSDILTDYLKFKQGIQNCPFVGAHKEEMLLLTNNVLKNITKWKTRVKGIPQEEKIKNELDNISNDYNILLNFLKNHDFPVEINKTKEGFEGLQTAVKKFILPVKKWKEDIVSFPKQQTQVDLTYDNKYIYLRFICQDPDALSLRANQDKHDSMVFTDDCVEFFIQPPDQSKYYHIVINSLGTVYDIFGDDKSWDSDIEVKVEKRKTSWTVMCKLPLSAIKQDNLKGKTLKFNFMREKHTGIKEFSSAFPVLKRFHEKERLWKLFFK